MAMIMTDKSKSRPSWVANLACHDIAKELVSVQPIASNTFSDVYNALKGKYLVFDGKALEKDEDQESEK